MNSPAGISIISFEATVMKTSFLAVADEPIPSFTSNLIFLYPRVS